MSRDPNLTHLKTVQVVAAASATYFATSKIIVVLACERGGTSRAIAFQELQEFLLCALMWLDVQISPVSGRAFRYHRLPADQSRDGGFIWCGEFRCLLWEMRWVVVRAVYGAYFLLRFFPRRGLWSCLLWFLADVNALLAGKPPGPIANEQ